MEKIAACIKILIKVTIAVQITKICFTIFYIKNISLKNHKNNGNSKKKNKYQQKFQIHIQIDNLQ